MSVVCVLAIMLNGSHEMPGKVVDTRGDYWLVDFSEVLDALKLKTEQQVLWLNSNLCLEVANVPSR